MNRKYVANANIQQGYQAQQKQNKNPNRLPTLSVLKIFTVYNIVASGLRSLQTDVCPLLCESFMLVNMKTHGWRCSIFLFAIHGVNLEASLNPFTTAGHYSGLIVGQKPLREKAMQWWKGYLSLILAKSLVTGEVQHTGFNDGELTRDIYTSHANPNVHVCSQKTTVWKSYSGCTLIVMKARISKHPWPYFSVLTSVDQSLPASVTETSPWTSLISHANWYLLTCLFL